MVIIVVDQNPITPEIRVDAIAGCREAQQLQLPPCMRDTIRLRSTSTALNETLARIFQNL